MLPFALNPIRYRVLVVKQKTAARSIRLAIYIRMPILLHTPQALKALAMLFSKPFTIAVRSWSTTTPFMKSTLNQKGFAQLGSMDSSARIRSRWFDIFYKIRRRYRNGRRRIMNLQNDTSLSQCWNAVCNPSWQIVSGDRCEDSHCSLFGFSDCGRG